VLGRFTAAASGFANKRGLYLGRRSAKAHVALYRRSGGRLGNHIPGWPEARIALVDHRGAKTGVQRTSPLMYLEDGDAIVLMASKAGQPTNPAWFHRLWARFVAIYPSAEAYRRNAGDRQIPIVVLEPR
jgi:F420H(2)-dependent quinone reductase